MEEPLQGGTVPDKSADRSSVEVGFRHDLKVDRLSPGELEVLGSHLPELMVELLHMIHESQDPE